MKNLVLTIVVITTLFIAPNSFGQTTAENELLEMYKNKQITLEDYLQIQEDSYKKFIEIILTKTEYTLKVLKDAEKERFYKSKELLLKESLTKSEELRDVCLEILNFYNKKEVDYSQLKEGDEKLNEFQKEINLLQDKFDLKAKEAFESLNKLFEVE